MTDDNAWRTERRRRAGDRLNLALTRAWMVLLVAWIAGALAGADLNGTMPEPWRWSLLDAGR